MPRGSIQRPLRLALPLLLVAMYWAAPLSAGCSGDSMGTGGTGGSGGGSTGAASESPPVCDAECPLVDNALGSKTKTLKLTAKGKVQHFTVEGVDKALHVSAYNDMLPGPTVEMETTASDPGAPQNSDILIIDLTNEGKLNGCCYHQCTTPAEPDSCWEPYCKGTGLHQGDPCVQVDTETNLHTHGLHIAAATAAHGAADACLMTTTDPANPILPWDNVFISVPHSGQAHQMVCGADPACQLVNRQHFVFPLAPQSVTNDLQPAAVKYPHWFGLQWYHPHAHEVSKDQLERGLAGALVIRNPAEKQIPVLANLPLSSERIVVLQRLPEDSSEMIQNDFVRLVNGKVKPRFTIKAGETQRWRIVNAGSDAPIHLSLDPHEGGDAIAFHPIGFDGIPTSTIRPPLASYWLPSGSRFEALITAPAGAAVGAVYDVTWCETDQAAGSGEPTDSLTAAGACTGTTLVGATLEIVEGAATPIEFSTGDAFADLASFGLEPDLWSVADVQARTIKFTQSVDAAAGAQFFLDVGDGNGAQQFSHDQICAAPIAAKLGDVEEWTMENWTTDIHSIHIHVNPFQVEPSSLSDALGHTPMYQDNVILPLGIKSSNPLDMGAVTQPGVVKIRIKHLDYTGTSVIHCHLLTHEDHGMMAAITVTSN